MSTLPVLHVSVPASLDKVSWLAEWLHNVTTDILREDEFILLEIGMVEIVNNIINHAYEAMTGGMMAITCTLGNRQVILQIIDGGAAMPDDIQSRFDNLNLDADPDPDATSGRGMQIIKRCFQQVSFFRQDGCNHITATFAPEQSLIDS